jgi:signal transduction histidine kinase
VFERFERAVPSSHYGGLGLGLYIARSIVLAHGGTITVDSEPGAGSTFTVLLPCAVPA